MISTSRFSTSFAISRIELLIFKKIQNIIYKNKRQRNNKHTRVLICVCINILYAYWRPYLSVVKGFDIPPKMGDGILLDKGKHILNPACLHSIYLLMSRTKSQWDSLDKVTPFTIIRCLEVIGEKSGALQAKKFGDVNPV